MEGAPESDAGTKRENLRVAFLVLWTALLLFKLLLAWRLPVFVDEAFYAWEARHLAVAYSDLPGLSAWLARLGLEAGGARPLALRLPFLLLGASLPWLVVRIARRWPEAGGGWGAGLLALSMPLSGLLGVMAMPDVPLVLAALLCFDAIAALRGRVSGAAFVQLALGLAMGALSHYRFAAVVLAGGAGLWLDPRARALLREPRLWFALGLGALAWWPLLQWNLDHAAAGLRFQLLERNPWQFHADAISWIPLQLLLVTPALFVLLLATAAVAWRRRAAPEAPWGLLAGVAAISVGGYFLLGFYADADRVSFHWPLAGWLALCCAAPGLLSRWRAWARMLVFASAGLGLAVALAFLACASLPAARSALAGSGLYPNDFAGWQEVGAWMRANDAQGERIIASDFELGAELAFALDRDDIDVLDSPLNRKHGRAAQLRLWGKQVEAAPTRPGLLIVDDSATPLRQRLVEYHRRCAIFGALPPPRILDVDHGRKRYLLYRFDPRRAHAGCIAPALAYIDSPQVDAKQPGQFELAGWAFKDGVGIERVEILLDARVVAQAEYGASMPNVAAYWRISSDPQQPRVGFRARVDASALAPGRHWLGLRLHGRDGSVEDWPEQPVRF
jgi:4-amino-4-deoxy-L-arabinose transferase-like glycosyltransferase